MRRLGILILVLLLCGVVRAQQYQTDFEPYFAQPAGFPLPPQDGWYNPIGGSNDFNVFTYSGNTVGVVNNPTGGNQFVAAVGTAAAVARAQHNVNFSSNDVWTTSWDMAVRYQGVPPSADFIGSFSLQDSTVARYFNALGSWVDVNNPTSWNMKFVAFDAAGNQLAPLPGIQPGPQWLNLQVNHWYRFSVSFSFSLNRILDVGITDLTTSTSTTVFPSGWYLAGGASPSLPIPTGIRLFAGGTPTAGNVAAYDNIDACPFQVLNVDESSGPEGSLVHIHGCGFGSDPNNLSVAVLQNSGNGVPLIVQQVSDNLITALVGPVRQVTNFGFIRVTRGPGVRDPLVTTIDDLIPEDPAGVLVWRRSGDPRTGLSMTQFFPSPTSGTLNRYYGQNQFNNIVLDVPNGTLPVLPNTTLRVLVKLQNYPQLVGADIDAQSIRMRCGSPPLPPAVYLADRICDVVQSALSSHGVNSTCTHGPIAGNERITLTLRDPSSIPIPLDLGIFDVKQFDPILISPFPIGPVTAFYHAGLTNLAGTALVSPVDATGNDGATISPNVPTTVGVRADTDLVPLSIVGNSFTARAWGTLTGQPHQLIGSSRLQRNSSFFDIFADFNPIGSAQVRIEVYYNTALKATVFAPAGNVGQVADGGSGLPNITGCGGRPTNGPNNPFLWFELDRPCIITPTGGSPVEGNQIRVAAGAGAGNVQNFQAFDAAAGLGGTDVSSFKIFSSVETGICYANCDGSSAPPMLNVLDFACFLNSFAAGELAANCDGSSTAPVLNILDFSCFINNFAAGCP